MTKEGMKFDDVAKLLARAQQAANQGDVVGMLSALFESRYLDGLVRRLQKKWRALPRTEVDECIARSVDAACDAVHKNRSIRNLGAWLWKAADNTADDRWTSDYSHRKDLGERWPDVADSNETTQKREEHRRLKEARLRQAVRVARELLPRIGEGQVRDVMELLIDAAEDGLPDLPASAIADSLGISTNAARMLVSRGLRRLGRLADEEGVEMPTDLPETDSDYEQQEGDDA